MSSIISTISSVISGCVSIIPVVNDVASKYGIKVIGLCILPQCGGKAVQQSLMASHTEVIDLDLDMLSELDPDELLKLNDNSQSKISIQKLSFNKALKSFSESKELLMALSKGLKQILVISKDYRLLKFCGISEIDYYVPSASLVQSLAPLIVPIQAKFDALKADMVLRKSDKMISYSSIDELVKLCSDSYGVPVKI